MATQMTSRPMSGQMQRCIDECSHCHAHCLSTVQYCLEQGGRHAEANHIRLMLDCAEICQTSANFMIRGSNLHTRTCAVCAEVCEQCAQDCDQFGDDQMMRSCAEACRSCAASCQEMAKPAQSGSCCG
ncbi:MAG TPA: four-helix bundle copper-binding protein [Tepidisphaeraceae bacterium]|nr:four-helix bundle copper-binding protein [Tepidisphaeraceae bacterium]